MKLFLNLFFSLILFSLFQGCSPFTETESHTIIDDGITTFNVYTPNGSITVNNGHEENIALTLTKGVEAFNLKVGEEILSKITIERYQDGDTYNIIADLPDAIGFVNITINNVNNKNVTLHSINGQISCEDILSGEITSTNGSVHVRHSSGSLFVDSTNGAVSIDAFSGALFDVRGKSGSIAMNITNAGEINGDLLMKNGNISLTMPIDYTCEVNLEAPNGGISINHESVGIEYSNNVGGAGIVNATTYFGQVAFFTE